MRWEGESWRPRIENSDVSMNGIISKFAVSLLTAFPSLLHLSQKFPRLQYALADIIYEEDAEEESPGPRPIRLRIRSPPASKERFMTRYSKRIARRRVRSRCLRRDDYNTPPFAEKLKLVRADRGARCGGLRRAAAGCGGLRRAAASTRKRTFFLVDLIKTT